MSKPMTPEREAEIRNSWWFGTAGWAIRDLLAELDRLKRERDIQDANLAECSGLLMVKHEELRVTRDKLDRLRATPEPSATRLFRCWYPHCNGSYYFMNSCSKHVGLEGKLFGVKGATQEQIAAFQEIHYAQEISDVAATLREEFEKWWDEFSTQGGMPQVPNMDVYWVSWAAYQAGARATSSRVREALEKHRYYVAGDVPLICWCGEKDNIALRLPSWKQWTAHIASVIERDPGTHAAGAGVELYSEASFVERSA